VSLIHKALRQAERASSQGPKNEYNPLSTPQESSPATISPLVIIGGLLIWAAIAVVAWPVTKSEVLTSEPETLIPEALTSDALTPESRLEIESEQSSSNNPATDEVPAGAATESRQDALNQTIVTAAALPGVAHSTLTPTSGDAPPRVASASARKKTLRSDRATSAAVQNATPTLPPAAQSSLTQVIPSTVQTRAKSPVSSAAPSARSGTARAASGEGLIDPGLRAELIDSISVEPPTDKVIVRSKNLWQQQVQQAVAEGAIEQAEAILKQWLGAAPSDPVPRIWLARIYINSGFYRAAEPLLTTLTGSDANALLGLIYERTDRPQLAAKLFEALYQVNPENGRWLLFWAINSENSAQLAKSRSLYQTYLTLFELEDPALTQFSQQRLTALGGY